jgi:unsaturated chondroitin disaccharide hydrolase
MHRNWRILVVTLASLFASSSWGHARIKNIKIAVTNPTAAPRPNADVVISVAEIRKVVGDFAPGLVVVTATDAKTVEEDDLVLQTEELPAQVDDLDGDGVGDELAFQINLLPHQTRIVTISYGDQKRISLLRSDYSQRTNAMFSRKFEGLGWESDRIAFRLYFDARNAIDIYAKRRPVLQLALYASPGYGYHDESPLGRDIFQVGGSLGIGSVGAMVDGKLVKAAEVKDRKWRIVSVGPVRSIVEVEYDGWNVGVGIITLRSRIIQWAGERGFWHTIKGDPAIALPFVTGVPLVNSIPSLTSRDHSNARASWVASWGQQVLAPGAKATNFLAGENLGLAVVTVMPQATFEDDSLNHFLKFNLQDGTASWYAMAAWDQEGSNRLASLTEDKDDAARQTIVLPPDSIRIQEEFVSALNDQAERMSNPVGTRILSKAPAVQPAPADTRASHTTKSRSQAIALIRENIDHTATKWEPILRSSPADSFGPKTGLGFFTEGDHGSGEWLQQNGYFWTGGFWVGELWQMYGHTHEEKYRKWAELWGSRMIGREMQQNHDAGFLFYYSSALGYDLTHQDSLKNSAHRAAERLEQLFNPRVQLIASWGANGDDTIIDTLMNLQLLWWVSEQTGETKWREIGKQHALRTAEWYVRPDGSTIQSVHYNPGDNRQVFHLHGGASHDLDVSVPNDTAPGDWVFRHTHQGYSPNTSWSRGQAWAIYGFTAAYQATHEPVLLKTAQRIADFALENLPDDGVPWYDFDDEGVHFRNRDSSAAAIMAGGLLRLATLTDDRERAESFHGAGERIVQSLINRYLAPAGETEVTPSGILRHGSATRPSDAMLIYGQYYLLEDLLWLEQHKR